MQVSTVTVNLQLIIDVGDEGSKVISELLISKNCKVKDLKLTKTNIGDDGAIIIFKALESNISVINLNICKNLLSEKSLDSIVNCLKINKTIKSVNLAFNLFNAQTKDKFKSLVRSNIKLIF